MVNSVLNISVQEFPPLYICPCFAHTRHADCLHVVALLPSGECVCAREVLWLRLRKKQDRRDWVYVFMRVYLHIWLAALVRQSTDIQSPVRQSIIVILNDLRVVVTRTCQYTVKGGQSPSHKYPAWLWSWPILVMALAARSHMLHFQSGPCLCQHACLTLMLPTLISQTLAHKSPDELINLWLEELGSCGFELPSVT